ncbi:MAG: GNAT family N-acetyltransferase, partial [Betaproteobacteria bacterium]|nr:GNAT family N-acetyltransferase [Betaproteobacteria bacterium]
MAGSFSVVPLDPAADRSGFECGVEPLDRYFKTQVTQDI